MARPLRVQSSQPKSALMLALEDEIHKLLLQEAGKKLPDEKEIKTLALRLMTLKMADPSMPATNLPSFLKELGNQFGWTKTKQEGQEAADAWEKMVEEKRKQIRPA